MAIQDEQIQPERGKEVDMRWVMISGICFLALILVSFLFMYYGLHLVGPDKAILYFIILSVLGIFSATFLFRVLRSYGVLKGKLYGYYLELGGPVVIFVLVIAGGYKFYQNPPPLSIYDMTVFFKVTNNPGKLLNGMATIRYGSLLQSLEIRNGELVKKEVERDKPIEINTMIKGYYSVSGDIYKTPDNGTTLTVYIKEDSVYSARKLEYARLLSPLLNNYLSDAKDVREYLTNDLDDILDNQGNILVQFYNSVTRYNESYRKMDSLKNILPAEILNYVTTDTGEVKALIGKFEEMHKDFFLGLNEDVDNINRYVSAGKKDENFKNMIKSSIKGSLHKSQGEFDSFSELTKDVQNEFKF